MAEEVDGALKPIGRRWRSSTMREMGVSFFRTTRGKKSVSCLTDRRMREIGKMRKRGSRREGPGLPARTRTISWTYSTTTNWTTRRTLRRSELTGCLAAGGVFENKTKKGEKKKKKEKDKKHTSQHGAKGREGACFFLVKIQIAW